MNCNSHVSCEAQIKCVWSLQDKNWTISERGVHGNEPLILSRSIPPALKGDIDELLKQGATAKQVIRNLTKNGSEVTIKASEINNRKQYLRLKKAESYGFHHNDDFREYARKHLITSKEEFQNLGIDDVFVLALFVTETYDIKEKLRVTSCGFAYTPKNLIQNLIRQHQDQPVHAPRTMDCTFSLDVQGWSHYSYGCNSLRRVETGNMTSQFRPASFGIHRTEREDCYDLLITS